MTRPPSWIHRLCGSPALEGCTEITASCWHCGGQLTRGMSVKDWMGASFVGQNRVKAPHSTIICEPCVFVMSRASIVPGRPAKDGKSPPNWRNFSVLVEGDQLVTATKGGKSSGKRGAKGSGKGAGER